MGLRFLYYTSSFIQNHFFSRSQIQSGHLFQFILQSDLSFHQIYSNLLVFWIIFKIKLRSKHLQIKFPCFNNKRNLLIFSNFKIPFSFQRQVSPPPNIFSTNSQTLSKKFFASSFLYSVL